MPSSRALLKVEALSLRLLTEVLDFRDFERGLERAAGGPLLASLKPLVCLKMFLLTLLIFFRDRLRRLSFLTEEPPPADLAEFLEIDLCICSLADLELDCRFFTLLLLDLERLVLRLALLKPRFFLLFLDFLLELCMLLFEWLDLCELALRGVRELREVRFLELDLARFLAEAGALLLPDLNLRIYCMSLSMSRMRWSRLLDSVASIISLAIISRLFENWSTRLLNYEG